MKYTEPKMELSVFDTENVITASAGGDNLSGAMKDAYTAAQDKAGEKGNNGVALTLVF